MDEAMMTRTEREDLGKVVRLRAKVTKASLETLAKDRCADIERQLSAIHQADQADWAVAVAEANKQVHAANAEIARVCDERGMRPAFRPSLSIGWSGRGENASAARRAELRKLAYARIEADRRAGCQLVDAWAAEKLTVLIAGALTTTEAKAFLEALPSPERLLPPVRITPELDGAIGVPKQLLECSDD